MEDSLKGQHIGYVRVSSTDQNPERQLEGVDLDRVFTDKASGKDTQRSPVNSASAVRRFISIYEMRGTKPASRQSCIANSLTFPEL